MEQWRVIGRIMQLTTNVNSRLFLLLRLVSWVPRCALLFFIFIQLGMMTGAAQPKSDSHCSLPKVVRLSAIIKSGMIFTVTSARDVAYDRRLAPFCAGCLPLVKFRTQLITLCVQVPSLHKLQITDDEYLTLSRLLPQEPRGPSLPMIIAFHFATLVYALRPLDSVMKAAVFPGMLG
jgi:hypothetical protein